MHRWYSGRQTFVPRFIGIVGVGISRSARNFTSCSTGPCWPQSRTALAVHHGSVMKEIRTWLTWRRSGALGVTVGIAAVFAFSFVVYNYVSAGRTTAWEFNDQLLNKPFNWHAALQTTILYTSQIVLTPFADLHIAFSPAARAEHYESINRLLAPLFSWVDNGAAYTSASYRFSGVNSPSAVAFNEQTVFIGFTWLVAALAAMWLAARSGDSRAVWPRFQLASLPVWAITFAAMTRYIEGFSVYVSYAAIVAAPAMVFALAPVKNVPLDRIRWALLAFVSATHCFFAPDIFLSSSPRNLIAMMRGQHWPVSRGFAIEDEVQQEIAASKDGITNRSLAWGQPFWATMFARSADPPVDGLESGASSGASRCRG